MAQTFGPKVLPQITPMEYINDSPLLPLPFDQLYKIEESLFQRDMMRERMDMEREKFGWEREQFEWAKEKQAWNMELEKLKLFQSLAGSTGTSGSTGTKTKGKDYQSIIPYNGFLESTNQIYQENKAQAEQELWSGFQNLDSKSPASYADYFNNARRKMAEVEGDPDVAFARMASQIIQDNLLDPDKVKDYDPIYMNDVIEDLKSAPTKEATAAALSRLESPDKYAVNYGAAIDERWKGIKDQLLLDPKSLAASLNLGTVFDGFTEEMLVATTDNMLPGYLSTPEGRAHFRNQMILAKRNDKDVDVLRTGLEAQGFSKQEIDETLQPLIEQKAEESVRQTFMSLGAKHLGIHGMHNLSKEALENIKSGASDGTGESDNVGGMATVSGSASVNQDFSQYNPYSTTKAGETYKEVFEKEKVRLEEENKQINNRLSELQRMPETERSPQDNLEIAELVKRLEKNSADMVATIDRTETYDRVIGEVEERLYRVKGPEYRSKIEESLQYFIDHPDEAKMTVTPTVMEVTVMTPDGPEKQTKIIDKTNLTKEGRKHYNRLKNHNELVKEDIDNILSKTQETRLVSISDKNVTAGRGVEKVTEAIKRNVAGNSNLAGVIAEQAGTYISGGKEVTVGSGEFLPEGILLTSEDIVDVKVSTEMYSYEGAVGNRIYITYKEKTTDKDGKQKETPKSISFIDNNNEIVRQLKGIPEIEEIAQNTSLNLALRPFYAYKDDLKIPITDIDYIGNNLDFKISRREGQFEIAYTDKNGDNLRSVNVNNVETAKDYIRRLDALAKNLPTDSAGNPTESAQDEITVNQTNLEILENIPELRKDESGNIINTNGVRINKLNDGALTLISSVLEDAFPNIWSSITSTLRERGGIDTDTGKPYEEVFGEGAMTKSDHSRFTYSPAFDVSIDDINGIPLEYFFDLSNIQTLMAVGRSGYEILLEGPSGYFGEFEKNFNSKGVFVHPTINKEIPHIKRLVSKQPHYHFGPRKRK